LPSIELILSRKKGYTKGIPIYVNVLLLMNKSKDIHQNGQIGYQITAKVGNVNSQPKRDFFFVLTNVFLIRIATVDMVLWDDTRVVFCDSQLLAIQCTWSS